jgi:hypothetical protein
MITKMDISVSVPEVLWKRAVQFALEGGHDIERDVLVPALFEYVKVQADARGREIGRCSSCNNLTIEGQCLECGWVAASESVVLHS